MRSVATKIFVTFAAALAAFAAAAGFSATRLHALGHDLQLLSEGYLPLTRIAAQLDVKDWVSSRALEAGAMDPAARRTWLPLARAHFPALVREKVAEGIGVASRASEAAPAADRTYFEEVRRRLQDIDRRWAEYDAAAQALFAAIESGEAAAGGAVPEQRLQAVRLLEKAISVDVKRLQASLDGQVADRVHAARGAESRTVALIVIYTLFAGVVGVAAAIVAQRLLAPIRVLTEGVKAVAAGDLSRKVDVRSGDEIGLLAREFNAMAGSLERQRQELLRAERLAAVGRISAQITHEIRNPLNAIGLNAELLADELERLDEAPGARGEARQLVAAIGREVDRLHAVTEEYLRFARLPKPVFAREDLNEILGGLVDFLRPELAAAQVDVRLELATGLPAIRADEGQLRAAFLNLLRNSREALPRGGSVWVRTGASAEAVEAQVEDTGPGIAPEALPRIFDPFYSTKERGTGLGLAFAQQVVAEHGGAIGCRSQPGRGACFTIRLPIHTEERAAGAGAVEVTA